MNIACDARSLVGRHTGVATWVSQVMAGLARDHGQTITLAASKTMDVPEELRLESIRTLPRPRPPMPGTLWLNSVLPHRLSQVGADVFIASLAVVPRRCPVPAVAMVHDITPRTHPHRHTLANRFCFNAYLEESLERAEAVVAGSAATESELLDHFRFVRPRLVRIGYGVDEFFSPAPDTDDGQKTRDGFAEGRRYILHLGTIEPRKGVPDLVSAWEELHTLVDHPPDLVVAGGRGWDTGPILARIDASPFRERIHVPGYVDHDEARDLLRHAEVFVLASEAEGFGLPLAEAISCGTPSVASDIPPLREAGGDAALFTPPDQPMELARAVAAALVPEVADGLRRRAAERAPELRWGPVVSAWNDLLQTVVAGHRSPTAL